MGNTKEIDRLGFSSSLLSDPASDEALAFWQARSKRELTREDVRSITQNMLEFFKILDEWEHEDQAQTEGSLVSPNR
jgi:hypothetical protein